MNIFNAAAAGERTLASPRPGDVIHLPLVGQPVFAQSGVFLARIASVQMDTSWTGVRDFFVGEGLYLLKLSGIGNIRLSNGAIHETVLGDRRAIARRYVAHRGLWPTAPNRTWYAEGTIPSQT